MSEAGKGGALPIPAGTKFLLRLAKGMEVQSNVAVIGKLGCEALGLQQDQLTIGLHVTSMHVVLLLPCGCFTTVPLGDAIAQLAKTAASHTDGSASLH